MPNEKEFAELKTNYEDLKRWVGIIQDQYLEKIRELRLDMEARWKLSQSNFSKYDVMFIDMGRQINKKVQGIGDCQSDIAKLRARLTAVEEGKAEVSTQHDF